MIPELVQLGLNTEESQVYVALLEQGRSTAGPIVKKTGLHRQIVYDTVEKLKKKGLVTESILANRKNWRAAHPEIIRERITDQARLADSVLPELAALYRVSDHRQEVRVFEGMEGFVAAHKNNLRNQPRNTPMYVIGSSAKEWVAVMQKARQFNAFEKERMRKNVIFQLLFFEDERKETQEVITKYYMQQPKEKRRVFRFLPEQFHSPVGIQIWHDNITMVIYSEVPLLIQIKNDLVVRNFKKYFDILWKSAKK